MVKFKNSVNTQDNMQRMVSDMTEKAAQDVFTDREDPRKTFFDAYNALKKEFDEGEGLSANPVIYYYGDTGIGKSSLSRRLRKELLWSDRKALYLDFDFKNFAGVTRDVIQELYRQAKERYNMRLPLTEHAAEKLSQSGQPFSIDNRNLTETIDSSRLLTVLKYGMNMTPLGGYASIATDVIEKLETAFGLNFMRMFKNGTSGSDNKHLFSMMDSQSSQDLVRNLPMFFFMDVCNALKDKPMVVFLDSYEHYVNPLSTSMRYRDKDLWLRGRDMGIVRNIPGIIWVISGRNKLVPLQGDEDEDSWSSCNIDEHLLGRLSMEDSMNYLHLVGVKEEELVHHIAKVSGGLPLHLYLNYVAYSKLEGDERRHDRETYARTLDKAIVRYFERMGDGLQDLACILSVFQDGWTDEMIDELHHDLPFYSDSCYERLIRDSSLIRFSAEDGRYHMEDNAREVIGRNLDERYRTRVTRAIAKYYDNRPSDTLRLVNVELGKTERSFEDFRNNIAEKAMLLIIDSQLEEAEEIISRCELSTSYLTQSNYDEYIVIRSLRALLNSRDAGRLTNLPPLEEVQLERLNDYSKCVYLYALCNVHYGDGNLSQLDGLVSMLEPLMVKEFGQKDIRVYTLYLFNATNCMLTGDADRCLALFKGMDDIYGESLSSLSMKIICHYLQGNQEQATAEILTANPTVRKMPIEARCLFSGLMSLVLADSEDKEELGQLKSDLEATYKEAEEAFGPSNTLSMICLYGLCNALCESGDEEDNMRAEQLVRNTLALFLNPKQAVPIRMGFLSILISINVGRDDYVQAGQIAQEGLDLANQTGYADKATIAGFLMFKGVCKYLEEQYEEAETLYRQAIAMCGSDLRSMSNKQSLYWFLSELLVDGERYDEAKALCTEGLKLFPSSYDLANQLLRCHRKQNGIAEAGELFPKVFALATNDDDRIELLQDMAWFYIRHEMAVELNDICIKWNGLLSQSCEPNDPRLVDSYFGVAVSFFLAGKNRDETYDMFRRVFSIRYANRDNFDYLFDFDEIVYYFARFLHDSGIENESDLSVLASTLLVSATNEERKDADLEVAKSVLDYLFEDGHREAALEFARRFAEHVDDELSDISRASVSNLNTSVMSILQNAGDTQEAMAYTRKLLEKTRTTLPDETGRIRALEEALASLENL